MHQCYFCKGRVITKVVTHVHIWEGKIFLFEDVPADVCQQCGEIYFSPDILVVHPPSLRCFWEHSNASLPTRPMPATSAPDKRMPMGVPVRCGSLNGLTHLLPRFKTAAFER